MVTEPQKKALALAARDGVTLLAVRLGRYDARYPWIMGAADKPPSRRTVNALLAAELLAWGSAYKTTSTALHITDAGRQAIA